VIVRDRVTIIVHPVTHLDGPGVGLGVLLIAINTQAFVAHPITIAIGIGTGRTTADSGDTQRNLLTVDLSHFAGIPLGAGFGRTIPRAPLAPPDLNAAVSARPTIAVVVAEITLHPSHSHTDEDRVRARIGHRRALPSLRAVALISTALGTHAAAFGIGHTVPGVTVVIGHTTV